MVRATWAIGTFLCCTAAWAQNSLVTPSNPGAVQWRPMTTDERIQWYIKRTTGTGSLARGVAFAGLATWKDSPEEWGRDADGFARRFAHRQARLAVNHSVQLGVGFLLKDDPRYYAAADKGVGGKLKNAVVSAFTVRNEAGGLMPAYSRFAGIAAGNIAAKTWLPPSRNSWSDVAGCAAAQIGGQVGWNVLREFMPGLKRKLGR